jgi:hypothetical protein
MPVYVVANENFSSKLQTWEMVMFMSCINLFYFMRSYAGLCVCERERDSNLSVRPKSEKLML